MKKNFSKINNLVRHFYQNGVLTKENYEDILEFFAIEEIQEAIKVEELDLEAIKDRIECAVQEMDKRIQKRYADDPMLKKEELFHVNQYAYYFYERAKFFCVLRKFMENEEKNLKEIVEAKICQKRFGNQRMEGGYYCPSPVMDLRTTNIERNPLYKRIPKDLKNKMEYAFDEKDRLILQKMYLHNERMYYIEYLFYSDTKIFRLQYESCDGKYWLEYLSIQNYLQDRIVSEENIRFCPQQDRTGLMQRETYEYEKDVLKTAWWEQYLFPQEKINEVLKRDKYYFRCDEEGFLESFGGDDYYGDKIKFDFPENFVKINKKKSKDTGIDAQRWYRPTLSRN